MDSKIESPTIIGKYIGNLRTELIHQKSGSKLWTDAPIDNNGKGEQFSPTDLLAGALASCILTVMAIRANENDFDLGRCEFKILKEMQSSPRQVKSIEIEFYLENQFTDLHKRIIDKAVKTCPVALSLNANIEQKVTILYDNASKID